MALEYDNVKRKITSKMAISTPVSPKTVKSDSAKGHCLSSDKKNDRSQSLPCEDVAPILPNKSHLKASNEEKRSTSSEISMFSSTASLPTMITPPYSSTVDKTHHPFGSETSLETFNATSSESFKIGSKRRSFRGRRRGIPSALDMDALNRDRQFTGPFSANPLLRNHEKEHDSTNSTDSSAVSPLTASSSSSNKSRNTPLPHLTPKEPQGKQVTLPLISELVTAAYLSPSRAGAPVSLVSPLSGIPRTSQPPWANDKSRLSHPLKDSKFREREVPEIASASKRTRLDSGWVHPVKKERFLKLCEEIWDLLNE